jgi:hypothetical protein
MAKKKSVKKKAATPVQKKSNTTNAKASKAKILKKSAALIESVGAMEIRQSAPVSIENAMDPSLQEVVLRNQENRKTDSSLSQTMADGTVLVDVLVRLDNPQQDVPGLILNRTIGKICTGQVEIEKVEEVRRNPNVKSLKLASRLHKKMIVVNPAAFPGLRAHSQAKAS